MIQQHPEDELTLTREGSSTRGRTANNDCLFRNRTPEEVRVEYAKAIRIVRDHFRKGWARAHELLAEDEFVRVTQDIALHHMYFYVVNDLDVRITKEDLDGSQTRDIVWRFSSEKFRKTPNVVSAVAASVLSVSTVEFQRWLEGWMRYLNK